MKRIKSVTHFGLIILAMPLVIVLVTLGPFVVLAFIGLKELARIDYGG